MSSVVLENASEFTHILRMQNTNVDGKHKVMFALRVIKGIGRRFANLVCKICQIDLSRRAGELTEAEMNKISDVLAKPLDYGIPKWFLNAQNHVKDGTYSQLISNNVDTRLREDLERMKKMRNHRGLRHFWNLKVKGQRTKSTGRTGKTLGVTRKK
jgi:small subunit ribosomal protein S18e